MSENQERKMATVRRVDAVSAIDGADQIEVATIGGWKVVVKKDEFKEGQLAIYCEIDSWIPNAVAPFLTKPSAYPKVYNEVEGERLRTIKLRGQISQGLLLPLASAFEAFSGSKYDEGQELQEFFTEGTDLSELLGIQKWEPPAEARPANAKGSFPFFIRKTDQERIQNLSKELEVWKNEDHGWQITEKLDGSSMTVYHKDGEIGVCSRNLELKDDGTGTFWETAKAQGLVDFLKNLGLNIALQGELIGGNIQGNAYKVDGFKYFVYDIFDIDTQTYWGPTQVQVFCEDNNILHVPVLEDEAITGSETTLEGLLKSAEGKSTLGANPEREGLVFKSIDTQLSFKVISNKWLLKNEG